MTKQNPYPKIESTQTLVLDFDGVFTNNEVYLNSEGEEFVACDRRDGMGLLILKNFLKKKSLPLKPMILSKEKNAVVLARAKKLGLECIHGVDDKLESMKNYFKQNDIPEQDGLASMVYLGNDLNDLEIMTHCGYSVAPNDAHPMIKEVADRVIEFDGGQQFIREFVESWLEINTWDKDFLFDVISNR